MKHCPACGAVGVAFVSTFACPRWGCRNYTAAEESRQATPRYGFSKTRYKGSDLVFFGYLEAGDVDYDCWWHKGEDGQWLVLRYGHSGKSATQSYNMHGVSLDNGRVVYGFTPDSDEESEAIREAVREIERKYVAVRHKPAWDFP